MLFLFYFSHWNAEVVLQTRRWFPQAYVALLIHHNLIFSFLYHFKGQLDFLLQHFRFTFFSEVKTQKLASDMRTLKCSSLEAGFVNHQFIIYKFNSTSSDCYSWSTDDTHLGFSKINCQRLVKLSKFTPISGYWRALLPCTLYWMRKQICNCDTCVNGFVEKILECLFFNHVVRFKQVKCQEEVDFLKP